MKLLNLLKRPQIKSFGSILIVTVCFPFVMNIFTKAENNEEDYLDPDLPSTVFITFKLIEQGTALTQFPTDSKAAVVVLGNSGSGIRTLVKILLNSTDLVAEEIPPDSKIFVTRDLKDNDTFGSKRFYPVLFKDSDTGINFYDFSGFRNLFSIAHDISSTFLNHKVATELKNIKFLFTVSYGAVKSDKSTEFLELLKHASEFISDIDMIENSILLVVTGVGNRYKKKGKLVEDKVVIKSIQLVMSNYKENIEDLNLPKRQIGNYIKLLEALDSRILLCRNPDKQGVLIENQLVIESRRKIFQELQTMPYTAVFKNSFNYSLSDFSRNEAHEMLDLIVLTAENSMLAFFNNWQKQLVSFTKKGLIQEAKDAFANTSSALSEIFKLNSTKIRLTPDFTVTLLSAVSNTAGLVLDEKILLKMTNYGKYVLFFETISGRVAKDLNLMGSELLAFVKYSKKYSDWYKFLLTLYDDFAKDEGENKRKQLLISTPGLLHVTTQNFPTLFARARTLNPWIGEFDTVGSYNLSKTQVAEFLNAMSFVSVVCVTSEESNTLIGRNIQMRDVSSFCEVDRPHVYLFATESVAIINDNNLNVILLLILAPTVNVIGNSSVRVNFEEADGSVQAGNILIISGLVNNATNLVLASVGADTPGLIKVINLENHDQPMISQPFVSSTLPTSPNTDVSDLYQFFLAYLNYTLPIATKKTKPALKNFFQQLSESRDIIQISGTVGLMQELLQISNTLNETDLKFTVPVYQYLKLKVAGYSRVMSYNFSSNIECSETNKVCSTPFTNIVAEQSPAESKALATGYASILAHYSYYMEFTQSQTYEDVYLLLKTLQHRFEKNQLLSISEIEKMVQKFALFRKNFNQTTSEILNLLSSSVSSATKNFEKSLESKIRQYIGTLNDEPTSIVRNKLQELLIESSFLETLHIFYGVLKTCFSTKLVVEILLQAEIEVTWSYLSDSENSNPFLISQSDISIMTNSFSEWFYTHSRNQMRVIVNELNNITNYTKDLTKKYGINIEDFQMLIEKHEQLRKISISDYTEMSKVRDQIRKNLRELQEHKTLPEVILQRLHSSFNILTIVENSYFFAKLVSNDKMQKLGDFLFQSELELKSLQAIRLPIYSFIYNLYTSILKARSAIEISDETVPSPFANLTAPSLSSFLQSMRQQLLQIRLIRSSYTTSVVDIMDASIVSFQNNLKQIEIHKANFELVKHLQLLNETDISNIVIEDDELSSIMKAVNQTIEPMSILWIYNQALTGFRQHVFPVAGSYLSELFISNTFFSKDASALLPLLKKNIQFMGKKLSIFQKNIRLKEDELFRFQEFTFDSFPFTPFYVWKTEFLQDEVKTLLQGKSIVLRSNIVDSLSKMEAIRFTKIRVILIPKNISILQKFHQEILSYNVLLTHSGTSHYSCKGKFYIFQSPPVEFVYSIKHDSAGNPIIWNEAYKKLENGELLLSPFSTWNISLAVSPVVGSVKDFSKLRQFWDEKMDIILEGSGMFLEPDTDLSLFLVEKYYEPDPVIFQLYTLKQKYFLYENLLRHPKNISFGKINFEHF